MLIKDRLSHQCEMTDVEKTLADYFLEKGNQIEAMSSRAIASELYVAPSTISRFLSGGWFQGFQ